jgi:hypothetical protein
MQPPHLTRARPMTSLILKRASAWRSSGEWNDDDFDVLADATVVGRIFKANAAPVGSPWMWTLAFGHHEDRPPTHGYDATREETMLHSRKAGGRSRHADASRQTVLISSPTASGRLNCLAS